MKYLQSFLAVSAIALLVAAPANGQSMPVAFGAGSVQSGAVPYYMGGFGLDDRAEMQRAASAYNVLFRFALPTGQFVVADSVTVKKGNDDVLQVSDAGPLLYMNLPYGTYTVQASFNGVVRSKSINVARRTPDVLLTWADERELN